MYIYTCSYAYDMQALYSCMMPQFGTLEIEELRSPLILPPIQGNVTFGSAR